MQLWLSVTDSFASSFVLEVDMRLKISLLTY